MDNKRTSLVEDFQQYFALALVMTPEQLESVFRVRYRVYCEEFGYEPAAAFPDQLEKDEFDAVSRHCLVSHKATGMPAGCARVVLASENTLMPMEKFCSGAIDQDMIRAFDGRRDTVCEFSRLGVDGAFRRRAGERASRFGEIEAIDLSKREQRTFSMIAVATILSALAMSELLERPNCFAMMEPFLPRLLRRSGLLVHPAGQEMEYHGLRSPYYFETHETLAGMVDGLQDFYRVIRDGYAATGALVPESSQAAPAARTAKPQEPSWWDCFSAPQFAL